MRNESGFTLIELMITVVILGILSAIAIPNFLNMRENGLRASCFSNQRHIFEGATLYIQDNQVSGVTTNVVPLQAAGYLNTAICECPSSNVADNDDYTLTIGALELTEISCDVRGPRHAWTPPPAE